MTQTLNLDPKTTALVVIDLQKGIAGMETAPHAASTVVVNSASLADAFRSQGAFVVLVNVGWHDGKDALRPITDQAAPTQTSLPPDWATIVPELGPKPGDHLVTKRQWGAFFGTDLDLQLRRRGIQTIVLCGIATHIGVETTAREAYQLGYQQVFVEDAMAARAEVEHQFPLEHIFPRMGRIRSTNEVKSALS